MAKKEQSEYYSRILINRNKKTGFFMLFLFQFIFMTLALMSHEFNHSGYGMIIGTILLISIPILIYPSYERWIYAPWQTKPQKYERHYRN